jgi:putative glycosyltransferase
MPPSISILLPVYNAENTVADTIESILRQSFEDYELLVIDDGSTDMTSQVVRSYTDVRIRYLLSEHNYISSLNLGLNQAQGKYIARMDADDIMFHDRLAIQHQILEDEPSITVCSSWYIPFGEEIRGEEVVGIAQGLISSPLLALLQGNLIAHPTVMLRSSFLQAHHLRYEDYPYAEDYKLWVEIAKRGGNFYIESQPLLRYRISPTQVTQRHGREQQATAQRIQDEILDTLIERAGVAELRGIRDSMHIAQENDILRHEDVRIFFLKLFQRKAHYFDGMSN